MNATGIRQHLKTMATKRNMLLSALLLSILVLVAVVVLQHGVRLATNPTSQNNGKAPTTDSTAKPPSAKTPTSDSKAATPAPTPSDKAATAAPTPTANASNTASATVLINEEGFIPNTSTIAKNTTLTWFNKGTAAHAIDPAENSEGPHSPQLKPGESYSYTFTNAGTYRYIDVMQPSHGGTVTVNN